MGKTRETVWEPGRLFQADSFTDKPFKGNPAGVVFCDGSESDGWMQNMAFEMNLSETAFVTPGEDIFYIRYFTPTNEVPLCGHATLASAHVLFEQGLTPREGELIFKAARGRLPIKREGGMIAMDFPSYSFSPIGKIPSFAELVGFEPMEMYESEAFVLAVASDESQVLNASPRFDKLEECGLGDLLITAESLRDDTDFVLRCFCPGHGINEDPVTGSAHCALVPLWHGKTGKTQFVSRQLSRRSGTLHTRLEGDRVMILGQAVTIFDGRCMAGGGSVLSESLLYEEKR